MKKIKLRQLVKEELQKMVSEVGEGTAKVYDWRLLQKGREGSEYIFNSEKAEYIVEIYPPEEAPLSKGSIVVSFYVNADEEADNKYEKITNLNEVYSVMATILNIVVEHVKANEQIQSIAMSPAASFKGDDRRASLYRRYMEKNVKKLPGKWDTTLGGDGELMLYKL